MTRIILIAALSLAACTGPGQAPKLETDNIYKVEPAAPAALSPEEKLKIQNAVLTQMDKPDSAQFGFMNAAQGLGGIVNVCGWVNGKNYLNRWEVFRPFYATYQPINQRAALVTLAKTSSGTRLVKAQCRDIGVPLSEQPDST